MKLTIQIDTEDPSQIDEVRELLQWRGMASVLWDIDQYLRMQAKHGESEEAAKLREEIGRIVRDNGVQLED